MTMVGPSSAYLQEAMGDLGLSYNVERTKTLTRSGGLIQCQANRGEFASRNESV